MRLLFDMIIVQIHYVCTIFDMFFCLFEVLQLNTKHEYARNINYIQQDLRQMWHVNHFIFEGKNETFDGLTAVDQLLRIIAHKQVGCIEKHPFEKSHHVVDCKTLEKLRNGLVVDVR